MNQIPLVKPDLPSLDDIEAQLREICATGKVTNFGKYVGELEDAASTYLKCHVVAVSSGTLGLILALQALGVKPGQEVILPSFTFMAAAQAVLYSGGIPVFAEVGADCTLSPLDLEMLLSLRPKVAAVMPVHLYGLPCDVEALEQIVSDAASRQNRRISLIYDAAHAFGASINGVRVGNFGNAEVFSLSVTKPFVSVEGGFVASKDIKLIERIRRMRNYGIGSQYNACLPGANGKMSEFHAVVGLFNLSRLDTLLAQRKHKAENYLKQLRIRTAFELIPVPSGRVPTFKDLTILMPENIMDNRDFITSYLQEKGIDTRTYFDPPIHLQSYFNRFSDRKLPFTERLCRRVITLPFFTTITDEEIDYIVTELASIKG